MLKSLVAITGKRGHGKTTAAEALMREGYRHINFADPVRAIAATAYGLTMEEMTDPVLKELPLRRWPQRSPREILQRVGTEMFRHYLDETWTQAFERACEGYSHVVCSDLRFLNEAATVRRLGGTVIRVVNPRKSSADAASQHVSELEMDQISVDWTIYNEQTVERLQQAVVDIVL